MGHPELSVIVPTFDRADETARAVVSALAQDVDLEIIIIDDGSITPIAFFDFGSSRVRVVRLETNQGAAAARNAGLAAAQSAWIAFLDSDDVWTVGSLRPRFEAAKKSSDPANTIWACGVVDVSSDGRRRTRIPRAGKRVLDFASGCWTWPGSTALFSRAAWERSGGQDPTLRRLEDYEWLFRWGLGGGRLLVHEVVGAEISRGDRASPCMIETAAGLIRAKHAFVPNELRQRMESYLALELAAARLHQSDLLGGALALGRSFLLKPRAQAALEAFWI